MIEQFSSPAPAGARERRLCLATDVEQYSRLDTRAQWAVQADLVQLLDEAAAFAGLDRRAWDRQPQGDSEFAVLPEDTSEAAVLGPFLRHLAACLRILNARPAGPRIRLRLAFDTGAVSLAALGHAGPTPVAVARYIDAHQLKAVLAGLLTADLAVIVSDRLYQDVVRDGHPDLDPAQYLRVHVRIKEFTGYAWLLVPGHGPDAMREFAGDPADPATPGAASRSAATTATTAGNTVTQHVRHGAAVGRDVNGPITIGPAALPPDADPRQSW